MKKMSTCLWFDMNAEEAVKFYKTVFKDLKVKKTLYYGENTPGPTGEVMVIEFTMRGQEFQALNGGSHFKFNEAISLVINCKDQREVDYFWKKLTANGGQEVQCGWLKDKFGISWQVVPVGIYKMYSDKNKAKSNAAFQEMLMQVKLDINKIKKAYESAGKR